MYVVLCCWMLIGMNQKVESYEVAVDLIYTLLILLFHRNTYVHGY